MRPHESLIAELFGDLAVVTILDKAINLRDAVTIDSSVSLSDAMREASDRRAIWVALSARVQRAHEKVKDALKERRDYYFYHWSEKFEALERAEMINDTVDEDEARDPFLRRKRVKDRISRGTKAVVGRWRRNFSDAKVWAVTHMEVEVMDLRKKARLLKYQQTVANGMLEVLDSRARHLSQLFKDECEQNRH